MFTLGNKEAIVNNPNQCVIVWDELNPDPIVAAKLTIQGFGSFDSTAVTDADAQRYQPEQLDTLLLTCPDPATELGITAIGTPVVVHLRVNSLRQASETAIDFIKRGRPMILEVKVDPLDTAADLADKVAAAFAEYQLKFLNSVLPVTFTHTLATSTILITATAGYFQVNESVTFLKRGDIFAFEAATTKKLNLAPAVTVAAVGLVNLDGTQALTLSATSQFSVGDTISFDTAPAYVAEFIIKEIYGAADVNVFPPVGALANPGDNIRKVFKGVEKVNDGKYLEENVRMSTPYTSDSYAINPQTVPFVDASAAYCMISWTAVPADPANGGWAAHKSIDIKSLEYNENRFTLYLNESNCLTDVTGPVAVLLRWLQQSGNVTAVDLKKANGASAEGINPALIITDFVS